MGGYPSRPRRIVGFHRRRKIRRNPTCSSRGPSYSTERSCRDVCPLTGAKNKGEGVRGSDHERLVKKLEDIAVDPDEKDGEIINANSFRNTASCQTPKTTVNETRGVRSALQIICSTDAESIKELLERNPCKFSGKDGTEFGHCVEKGPHLHGYLDGIPIVLKLADTDEELLIKALDNRGGVKKSTSSSSSTSQMTAADTGIEEPKKIPCDTGRRKTTRERSVARQTSPMRRIRSANTSPCSFSRECLNPSYSFARSKCSRKNECVKKCATASTGGIVTDEIRQKKPTSKARPRSPKSGETKGSKRRPWITPPIPALKSEPLSDPSSVPAHIWYGDNAYAYFDDEPKPRNTFNSENTTGKKSTKRKQKEKRQKAIKGPQIIAKASLTKKFENSPFTATEIKSENKSLNDYMKEDNEAFAIAGTSKSGVEKPREFATYSVLLNENYNLNSIPVMSWLKNLNGESRWSDILHGSSKPCFEMRSKYTFLFEKNWNSFQDSLPPGNNDYFAAPVRVPKFYKFLRKKWKNSKRNNKTATVAASVFAMAI